MALDLPEALNPLARTQQVGGGGAPCVLCFLDMKRMPVIAKCRCSRNAPLLFQDSDTVKGGGGIFFFLTRNARDHLLCVIPADAPTSPER